MKHLVNLTLVSLILAVASAVIVNVPSADASTATTAGTAAVAREAGKTPKPKQLLRKALKGSKKAKPTKRVAGRTTPLPLKGSAADRISASPTIAIGGQGCTGWSGGLYWCFTHHNWYDSYWLRMFYITTDVSGNARFVTCFVAERGFGAWSCYWGLH